MNSGPAGSQALSAPLSLKSSGRGLRVGLVSVEGPEDQALPRACPPALSELSVHEA